MAKPNFLFMATNPSVFESEFKGNTLNVEVRTLDSLLAEKNVENVDVIKMDVQGAELEVLKGAEMSINKCKVLQMEVSFRKIYKNAPLAHEIIKYMADKGFRIFDIASAIKRKEDRALLQADLFFVNDENLFMPETWEYKK